MGNHLIIKSAFILIFVFLLGCSWDLAHCQTEDCKVTVVFGSGEKIELSDWSFVYHITRRVEVLAKGSSPQIIEKKSQNLYLVERYDEEEGKTDFGKGRDISIDCKKLSSVEYLWNWDFGNVKKVIITLTDGTILERLRLGPISISFFGDEKFLYGEGIYLEGNYTLNNKWKHLKYNLNKWRKGEIPKKEIITKIVLN